MIKAIHGGPYIYVSGSSFQMPYIDDSRASAGMVRYKNYNFEVYDGNNWLTATASAPTIDLSPDAIKVIEWAKNKMAEEALLKILIEDHPAIKNAYDNVKKAEEQLKTTIILSKDEKTTS